MSSLSFVSKAALRGIDQLRAELPQILPEEEAKALDEAILAALKNGITQPEGDQYQEALKIIDQNPVASERKEAIFKMYLLGTAKGAVSDRGGFGGNIPAGDSTDIPLPGDRVHCPKDPQHYHKILLWKNQSCLICGALLVKTE